MKLEHSYLVTMSLLVLHQIDAAYWKEWEMFHLPGGVQGFLLFNIAVIPIIFFGYRNIICKSETAKLYSYLCGGLGVLTFMLHLGFALVGAQQFHLPLSIVIIILCLVFGVWQIILAKRSPE